MGLDKKESGGVFRGGLIPQCTLWVRWGWGILRNGGMILKWGGWYHFMDHDNS